MKKIFHTFVFLAIFVFLSIAPVTAQNNQIVEIAIWYAPESASYLDGENGLIARFNSLYDERINPVTGQVLQPDEPIVIVRGRSISSGTAATDLFLDVALNAWRSPEADLPTIYQPSVRHWLTYVNGATDIPVFDQENTQDTAVSWVVIAVFDTYSQRFLSMGDGSPGWDTLLRLHQNPFGWGDEVSPEDVEYAHFNPHQSSTGLSSLMSLYYAMALQNGLLLPSEAFPENLINKSELTQSYNNLYDSITRLPDIATSGGTITNLELGTDWVHLMPLEEDVVINYNCRVSDSSRATPEQKLYAIYPADGSFAHTHPMAVPEPGYWVDETEREAAQQFIEFVRLFNQQQFISSKGFRPVVEPEETLNGDLFSEDCGVEANVDIPELIRPDYSTINTMQSRWTNQKPVDYIMVIDTSGSMGDCGKLDQATEALQRFVLGLDQSETVTTIQFSGTVEITYPRQFQDSAARNDFLFTLNRLFADDETALYDAVNLAIDNARILHQEDKENSRLQQIIILSDGADSASLLGREALIQSIRSTQDPSFVEFFPILYTATSECPYDRLNDTEQSAALSVMQEIAQASGTALIFASEENINEVIINLLDGLRQTRR